MNNQRADQQHPPQVIDRFTEVVGLDTDALYVFDCGAPTGFRVALAHPERVTAIIAQNGNAHEKGLHAGWIRIGATPQRIQPIPLAAIAAADGWSTKPPQSITAMNKFIYYLVTLCESVLGVFGVRSFYDQPRYTVVERLDRGVEIRAYEPRLAVETDGRGLGDGAAFGRLFRYITGANQRGDRIAMTAPVETGGQRIAMTVPVEQGTGGTMRFFLPHDVAEAGAPEPTEAGVRLVHVPAETIAALRFSGSIIPEVRAEQERILIEVVVAGNRKVAASPVFMGYDPPFAIPFLRRNEVAVQLAAD